MAMMLLVVTWLISDDAMALLLSVMRSACTGDGAGPLLGSVMRSACTGDGLRDPQSSAMRSAGDGLGAPQSSAMRSAGDGLGAPQSCVGAPLLSVMTAACAIDPLYCLRAPRLLAMTDDWTRGLLPLTLDGLRAPQLSVITDPVVPDGKDTDESIFVIVSMASFRRRLIRSLMACLSWLGYAFSLSFPALVAATKALRPPSVKNNFL